MGVLSWLSNLLRDRSLDGYNAMSAVMDRQAARFGDNCPICNKTDVFLCPMCREPISLHSHENDYSCDAHGYVHPIRQSDGARINGDGRCSDAPRVLEMA